MKIFGSPTANSTRVKIFLAEKGLDLPWENVDIFKKENRTSAFRKLNSLAEVPVLQLETGETISESMAICRYFEALHPNPTLFGETPVEQARIEMWNRRTEYQILRPLGDIIEHTLPGFADKVEQLPEFAATQRRRVETAWIWLDNELSDGRRHLAGDRFSVADITAICAYKVTRYLEIPISEELMSLHAWVSRVDSRPSLAE